MTDSELKKSVFSRIDKARKDGLSAETIAEACGEGFSLHTVYDILGARRLPIEVWYAIDRGLENLGYVNLQK